MATRPNTAPSPFVGLGFAADVSADALGDHAAEKEDIITSPGRDADDGLVITRKRFAATPVEQRIASQGMRSQSGQGVFPNDVITPAAVGGQRPG